MTLDETLTSLNWKHMRFLRGDWNQEKFLALLASYGFEEHHWFAWCIRCARPYATPCLLCPHPDRRYPGRKCGAVRVFAADIVALETAANAERVTRDYHAYYHTHRCGAGR